MLHALIGWRLNVDVVGVCENRRTGLRYWFERGKHRGQRVYRVWYIAAHACECYWAGDYMDKFKSVEWHRKDKQ